MEFGRQVLGATWQVVMVLLVLVSQRLTRGGYLFMATPGYGGVKPAGLWGGFIQHSNNGQAVDLYTRGYDEIHLPTAYLYDGIRINTVSYDPRTQHALVQVEDVQRQLTIIGSGGMCAPRDPYKNALYDHESAPGSGVDKTARSAPSTTLLTTIIPDVKLDDYENPFLLHTSCGWKCGWSGFALFGGRVYFTLSAVFGRYPEQLRRHIEIRVLNSVCDDQIQKAIKYEQVGTELLVLECSDHVVIVYEHDYSTTRGQQDISTWVAGPLKVVQGPAPGRAMYFLLQLIQKADCDVTMSLVQTSNLTSSAVWVHNVSLPSIYGGNARIRGFGSIDYRDGMLCWTAAEVLLCGPIAGDQVSLVSMLLPPGAAHSAGICTGDLPLGKVLTGVAVASSVPLRVYFGCHSELSSHGGAGLVEVNLSSANEVVKHVYAVTSGGKKVFASGVFYVDILCGPCTENCDGEDGMDQTTSAKRMTTSGVMSSRPWLDGSPQDGALTGSAWTVVTTFKTAVALSLHTMLVLILVL